MHPSDQAVLAETRRQFFARGARGIGGIALASMLAENGLGDSQIGVTSSDSLPGLPHFAPKAKRCIYLHAMGAPPQMDLLDHKPKMKDWYDKDLPASIRQGQRLTTMTSGQSRFPIAPSVFKFKQHGQSGAWISELLPNVAKMADDIAIIRSMHTEAINHEPAITFIQTGRQVAGRPCIGSWLAYGLGSMNNDLPTFAVMNAERSHPKAGVQAISARLWSAGFLSAKYAGVGLRGGTNPVLYIQNPDGVSSEVRRTMLDGLSELNRLQHAKIGDPETLARIEQFEMAFRMQSSVPEMSDLASEPESTFKRWGEEAKQPGKFQNAALMARRLIERGTRFVQIYHRGWDVHSFAPEVLPAQARDVDQASYALIQDLKERGLFEDTLVIWGGEFGRTIYSQGKLTPTDYGRDHHPRCYSLWMAGGGVKGGVVHGETDDFSYNIVKDPVHIRDFQATILHLFGIDHERFTHKHQGLDAKLTGVEPAHVVKEILA
ncbi:MAG: sulfatase [Solibacterales bacterium]|nr:sulfatase [Bryobacterales bacterium]|tara:strand:- start:70020 stop:71489 length:1470 start_codon:yes stop_codon:yes gene_type:complete